MLIAGKTREPALGQHECRFIVFTVKAEQALVTTDFPDENDERALGS